MVVVIQHATGLVTGLSVVDGSIVSVGIAALEGEPLSAVYSDREGVLMSTEARLLALRQRPVEDLVRSLREALVKGDRKRVEELDAVVLRLASHLEDAAAAHGMVIRHGFLAVTAALARGGGASEVEHVRDLLLRGPTSSLAPLAACSRGLNNLLSDWLLPEPSRLEGAFGEALMGLVDAWMTRLEIGAAKLATADARVKDAVLAAALQLGEALDRGSRKTRAQRLVRLLHGLGVGLTADQLPPWGTRVVLLQAAELARGALKSARGKRLDDAVADLEKALALPFASAVIPRHDPSRMEIEVLAAGEDRVRKRDVIALAKGAYRAWEEAAEAVPAGGEIACYETCTRKWSTCERPCVPRAACDEANRGCVASCESARRPSWTAPTPEKPVTDPAFLKCL